MIMPPNCPRGNDSSPTSTPPNVTHARLTATRDRLAAHNTPHAQCSPDGLEILAAPDADDGEGVSE